MTMKLKLLTFTFLGLIAVTRENKVISVYNGQNANLALHTNTQLKFVHLGSPKANDRLKLEQTYLKVGLDNSGNIETPPEKPVDIYEGRLRFHGNLSRGTLMFTVSNITMDDNNTKFRMLYEEVANDVRKYIDFVIIVLKSGNSMAGNKTLGNSTAGNNTVGNNVTFGGELSPSNITSPAQRPSLGYVRYLVIPVLVCIVTACFWGIPSILSWLTRSRKYRKVKRSEGNGDMPSDNPAAEVIPNQQRINENGANHSVTNPCEVKIEQEVGEPPINKMHRFEKGIENRTGVEENGHFPEKNTRKPSGECNEVQSNENGDMQCQSADRVIPQQQQKTKCTSIHTIKPSEKGQEQKVGEPSSELMHLIKSIHRIMPAVEEDGQMPENNQNPRAGLHRIPSQS